MFRHHPGADLMFSYRAVKLYRTKPLGAGAYGSVFRALCDELPCAAKILHPAFFQFDDPGSNTVLQRFEQECNFLSTVRHPNIIQYLGTYQDPETKLPVLLMELMDESLTKFLDRTSANLLPYSTEVDLCHDVVLALAYLHSSNIVHRDLSSNNVLLIAGSRAKLTDFGMAKLVKANPRMTPLTQCPGNTVYMSPEALRNPPVYTEKLDSFSFGVLVIQTLSHRFPSPAPPREIVRDSRYPTGKIEVPVPEVERRKEHIQLIQSSHPLLQIAMSCLADDEEKRPSTSNLCQSIAALKEMHLYEQSVYKQQVMQQSMLSQASSDSSEISPNAGAQGVANKASALQDGRLKQLEESEENLKKKLQELTETVSEKEKQIEELQKLKTQESGKPSDDNITKFSLQWRTQRNAPCEMSRGSVAIDGNVAYIAPIGSQKVYSYTINEGKWCSSHPEIPRNFFKLVILENMATVVGGTNSGMLTNLLLSLVVDGHDSKWCQKFPPFPTKRISPAIVSYHGYLLVAGGKVSLSGSEKLSVVEVMRADTKQWFTATSLPYPACSMAATVCRDNLYLTGGFNEDGATKSVLSCSFSALVQSSQQPNSLRARIKGTLRSADQGSATNAEIWQNAPIPEAPVYHPAIVTLRDELIVVGSTLSVIPSTEVWMYSATAGSWLKIGQVPTARDWSLVAVLPGDELIVIGGCLQTVASSGYTDIVEIASIC